MPLNWGLKVKTRTAYFCRALIALVKYSKSRTKTFIAFGKTYAKILKALLPTTTTALLTLPTSDTSDFFTPLAALFSA
jgi:hypothetical protein